MHSLRSAFLVLLGALAFPAAAAHAQNLTTEEVVTGLNAPVAVKSAPGDPDRLYVVEQNGVIEVFNLVTATFEPPLLDLSSAGRDLTFRSGERGLLGLAFHPDFAANGRFYVNYTTAASPLRTIVAEYVDADGDRVADPTPGTVLVEITQDFGNHNGGDIHFGPEGLLYVGMGDGGSANDPNERGQDPQSLLGKMLRLDPDSPATNYIPANNPYLGDPAVLDAIWAFGLRNPFRFSFDRLTGDLWIGDVGQDAREEINYVPGLLPDGSNFSQVAALNYGWDCREGDIAAPASGRDCSRGPDYYEPVYVANHPDGCSITGGVVYRGTDIPELDGVYFFADYCGGWVRSLELDQSGAATNIRDWSEELGLNGAVAFGEDPRGELLLVDIFSGRVLRIVEIDGPCGCLCELTGGEGPVFTDRFETDLGWTTVAGSASDGQWERGVPIDDPSWAHDPPTDASGGGAALLTDNAPGNSDVDGGATIVLSPPIDTTAGAITICYRYFLKLTNDDGSDSLRLEASSNGGAGPWTEIARHDQNRGLAWTRHAVTQAELDSAGVSLSTDTRFRFIAQDAGAGSIVEAGVDEFRVLSANIPDCNSNGVDDRDEILAGDAPDCNNNGVPDSCDIADGASLDCAGGPLGDFDAGAAIYINSCIGCHGVGGLGQTGPNLRNVDRSTIRQRLSLEVFHPGGAFPDLTGQQLADLEAYLRDGGTAARPDGVPDECQSGLADCDGDDTPDACELAGDPLADANQDGVPDGCQSLCTGDLNGDGSTDVADFFVLAGSFGVFPAPFAGGDVDGSGRVDVGDFFLLAGSFGCETP